METVWISIVVGLITLGAIVTALVLGILYGVSFLAGWGALARNYRADETAFKGSLLEEARPWQVWVGPVRYRNIVRILIYEYGVELRNAMPFLPPLFFRWEDIHGYGPSKMLLIARQPHQFYVDDRRILFTAKIQVLEERLGSRS